VQGRAGRHGRRADLLLHAGRLHRPVPRPAPPGLTADQGARADRPRRRLLARRLLEAAADPDLRDGLLLPGGPGHVPAAARGGEAAGPPPTWRPARPLPLRRALARLAALASQRHGHLQPARGPPPPRERAPRLSRGEDAADLRQGALAEVAAFGELPREHVPDPARA